MKNTQFNEDNITINRCKILERGRVGGMMSCFPSIF